jgi:hypothetical protein
MARLRPIRSIAATLLVGALFGFLIPSFVVGLQPENAQMQSGGESLAARQFIVAFLSNDQEALRRVSLQPAAEIEAARLGVTNAKVSSLTFLGSSSGPGLRLHSYAVEFTNPDGTKILRGYRVATVGRYAVLSNPPEPLSE